MLLLIRPILFRFLQSEGVKKLVMDLSRLIALRLTTPPTTKCAPCAVEPVSGDES